MFPLGAVVLPSELVTLQILEPRYLTLIKELSIGEDQFGVVLIERGSEVGGGDTRSDLGTLVRVGDIQRISKDRLSLTAVGVSRIRILEWLPERPYPIAVVDDFSDQDLHTAGESSLVERYEEFGGRVRGVLEELSESAQLVLDSGFEYVDDPRLGTFQLGALLPLSHYDRQRLLVQNTVAGRLDLLDELLIEIVENFEWRMGKF